MKTDGDPLGIVGRTVADKYLVETFVGEGGFSVVYRASHTLLKRPVAIKFFNQLSSAPVDQRDHLTRDFIQEGALLSELSSETAAIVQSRDAGSFTTPDGVFLPYLVLEWLEGTSLEALLEKDRHAKRPPWTVFETLRCLGPVFGALQVAHRRGVTHRDVKPGNVFIMGSDPRAGEASVKLLDFGVAKLMADATQLQASLARTGTLITSFTPQYGAPEQFSRTMGATGPWTDVFALALLMVELLTGRTALDGDDIVQLAYSASNPTIRPTPRRFGVSVSDELEAVFTKALAPSPEHRYANAAEFWSALDDALGSYAGSISELTIPVASRRSIPTDAVFRDVRVSTPIVHSVLPISAPPTTHTTHPSGAPPTAHTADPASGRKPQSRALMLGVVASAAIAIAAGIALLAGGQGRSTTSTPSNNDVKLASMPQVPVEKLALPPPRPPCPDDMVLVPAGQYFMGSDSKDAMPNEKPVHNVALDSYCIDLYEVTAGKYKACSDVGKCRRALPEVDWPKIKPEEEKAYASACTLGDPAKTDHPVNCVNWGMADTYCKAQEKRLPTEAEWEFATRGPDGRVYPWGDEPPTSEHLNACGAECVAWGNSRGQTLTPLYQADDHYPTTAPVGSFTAGRSRYGLYDVVGNVWEWVSDWYGDYDDAEKKNPQGPGSGEKRVIRGGGWNGSYATWLRPSFRYAQDPTAKSHGIGFRCAAAPTSP